MNARTGNGFELPDWHLVPAPSSRPHQDRFIGLLNKSEDFNCVLLASMGLGDDAIRSATGLTNGQIQYRLRKAREVLGAAHMTRREFRRGESPIARMLVNKATGFFQAKLTHTLRSLPDHLMYAQPSPRLHERSVKV